MALALRVAVACQLSQRHGYPRVLMLEGQNRNSNGGLLRSCGVNGSRSWLPEKPCFWTSSESHSSRSVRQILMVSGKPALQMENLRSVIWIASENGILSGHFLVLVDRNQQLYRDRTVTYYLWLSVMECSEMKLLVDIRNNNYENLDGQRAAVSDSSGGCT